VAKREAWVLAAWLLSLVLWVTWMPFIGREAASHTIWRISTNPLEVLGNVGLFAPMAMLVAMATRGPVRRRLMVAVAAVAVASAAVELVQLRIIRRTPAVEDWVLNTSGGVLGAWLGATVPDRVRPLLARVVPAVLLTAGVVYVMGASLDVREKIALSEWRPGFQVVSGNEVGGQREYRGAVTSAVMCAGRGEDPVCVEPGAAPADRRAMVRQATASQRVTVAAEVLSRTDRQTGPARIVTFSRDPLERNLTLGQQERDLVLRFRSALTGVNGARPQIRLTDAVPTGVPVAVSAEYDRGAVVLRTDDGEDQRRGAVSAGVLQGWFLQQPRPLFGTPLWEVDVRAARVAAAATALVMLTPLGYLAARAGGSRPAGRMMIAIAAVPVILAAMDSPGGLPLPEHLILALGAGALGGAMHLFVFNTEPRIS
jgi:glycopeptide antibiotics resistance protein